MLYSYSVMVVVVVVVEIIFLSILPLYCKRCQISLQPSKQI